MPTPERPTPPHPPVVRLDRTLSDITPDPAWMERVVQAAQCPHCDVTVTARYTGPATHGPVTSQRRHWIVTSRHSPACTTAHRVAA